MNELQKRLDQLMGYVTMYKLVNMGLVTIALFALPLMMIGYLPYSPVGFLINIFVLVVASYGSNRLLGWLFGVKPQLDSALITALILALLFSPPATFIGFVQLALVVVIAMASKYVISIQGKHIFNPAAFAIVLASISGLAFASWWVAAPALLPVTLIVVLLVLYKTQKITMAGVFIISAAVMIILQSLLNGSLSLQVLTSIFTSWPLLFFAGIMLIEPLTLPPTKRQQLILAVVIGILSTLSVHYAGISMTPASALVIGNAIAFFMGAKYALRLRFVAKKRHGSDIYEFVFDTKRFDYAAGQYTELSLPHSGADFRGSRRIFTMIGRPGEEQISIATRFPENHSTYKDTLLALKPGDIVHGLRVAGDFTLPVDKSIPIVCIAGGIGITPFVSFAMNESERDITILYSVKSMDDVAFVKEFEQYGAKVVIVTPDTGKLPSKEFEHEKGMITPELLKQYIKPETHIYVSGPPAMVASMKQSAKRVGATYIHTDLFSGY